MANEEQGQGAQGQMQWPFGTPPVTPGGEAAPQAQPQAADPPVTQQAQQDHGYFGNEQQVEPIQPLKLGGPLPPMPTARLRTKGYDIAVPQPFRTDDLSANPWAPHLAEAATAHLNQLLLDEAKKIAQPIIEQAAQTSQPLSNGQLEQQVWQRLADFDFRRRRKREAKPTDPVEAKARELAQERVVRYLIDVKRAASTLSELKRTHDIPASVDLYLHKHPELRQEAEQIVRAQQAPSELGFEPVLKG